MGNVKQFIYNGSIPVEWKANIKFAINSTAFPADYRPKATFGKMMTIAGGNIVANLDFTSDGFIRIKPTVAIPANSWVTIQVCYI